MGRNKKDADEKRKQITLSLPRELHDRVVEQVNKINEKNEFKIRIPDFVQAGVKRLVEEYEVTSNSG